MPLKTKTVKRRDFSRFNAVLYRLPMPVTAVLQTSDGYCYPICPRCDCTFDREYASFCDRCGQHLAWELYDFASVIYAPRRK